MSRLPPRCLSPLPLVAAALALLAPIPTAQSGATTRVSVMTDCNVSPVNLGNSTQVDISDNGQFVAFRSNNSSLGQGTCVVAWFANLDGAGGFGPMQLVTSALSGPSGVDVGCLDADVLPDVVTSALIGDRIDWFPNGLTGSGGFAGPLEIDLGMDNATTVTCADLDGDGDLDVLGTASELGLSAWWPNDGRGGFGPRTDITPYGGADVLVPEDMDADGDLDVLFGRLADNTVGWQENVDGAGHFSSEHVITGAADGPRAVVSADFDGDGDLDVVLGSDGSPAGPRLVLWRNTDGQGAFGNPTLLSTASDVRSVDAADLDGDGDRDVLAALGQAGGQCVWFRNNGAGVFGPAIVVNATGGVPTSVHAEDLDGDGDRDYLLSSVTEVAWFTNATGTGDFNHKQAIGSSLFLPQQTRAADVDGDGARDVLVVEGNSVEWYRNVDGLGSFGSKQLITSALPSAVDVDGTDMDGDGDLDVLATSEADDQLVWYPNLTGTGSFGPAQVVSTADLVAHSAIGRDLDADGDTDILAYKPIDRLATWYENTDGLGTAFAIHDLTQPSPASGSHGRHATTADIDGDGDLDVLVAGGLLGDCSWFENPDGHASFGACHVISTAVSDPRGVCAADLDGDGDRDVLSASFWDAKLAWYRNLDGQGHFGPQVVISTAAAFADWVTTGDIDGDGTLDVVGAGAASDDVLWFANLDGQGGFGPPHAVTSAVDFPRRVAVDDIDGDGDADVLTVSSNDDQVAWHENTDGTGLAFTPHVLYDGPGTGAVSGCLADMDADGDLDAIFASASPGPSGFEIYVHDRLTLETHWVTPTLDSDGAPDAQLPALSADGRYVAFESKGLHVPGPQSFPNVAAIYVRDLPAGVTERVSVSSTGEQANSICGRPSVSGDGRFVAFESSASNLVAGDPTCCDTLDLFLRDRLLGTTVLANPTPGGGWPDGGSSPELSADGQFLAFVGGSEQVLGDTNPAAGIFVRDLVAGVTERASLGNGGAQIVDASCTQPSISGDGRYVAFITSSQVDPADTNPWPDVYVRDRATGTTLFASATSTGGAANGDCQPAQISADGRSVAFIASATNLLPGLSTSIDRVYRRDLQTGELTLMSVATDGTPASAQVGDVVDISGDGQLVAFSTAAPGLVASDIDSFSDAFVHGEDPWFPLGCDTPGASAPLLNGSGPMEGGSAGKLALSAAKPSSLSVLFVSLASNPAPFKGGLLVAFPPVFQVPLFTGPGGALTLHFTWPHGVPAGLPLFFHQAIVDPAAPQGVALSTSLKSVAQ